MTPPHKPVHPGHSHAMPARSPVLEERRRAQRVVLRMPIVVRFQGQAQPVEGFTHTVSENGAMIVLPEHLTAGTKLSVENPSTQKRVDARVVRPPQLTAEGSLVPVEFAAPAPNFWNIFFPPAAN
jgi:hypothetical protein